MTTLRILMLLATVAICYLLFLHSAATPPPGRSTGADVPGSLDPAAHSQYKQAMDKAHAAARQMQAQRAEADAQ